MFPVVVFSYELGLELPPSLRIACKSRDTEDYFMGGIEVVAIEHTEVQFALLEEAGDVVRIPMEVVDFFQDFRLEFVVGSDIPSGEDPRSGRSECLRRYGMAQ